MRRISLRKRKISFTEGVRQLGRRRIGDKSARWMTKRIVVLQMLPLYVLVRVRACAFRFMNMRKCLLLPFFSETYNASIHNAFGKL